MTASANSEAISRSRDSRPWPGCPLTCDCSAWTCACSWWMRAWARPSAVPGTAVAGPGPALRNGSRPHDRDAAGDGQQQRAGHHEQDPVQRRQAHPDGPARQPQPAAATPCSRGSPHPPLPPWQCALIRGFGLCHPRFSMPWRT